MSLAVKLCKALNRLFPRPVHPFNLAAAGQKTYAEWQYEQGHRTLQFYVPFAPVGEILRDRDVLDIGCGAGGKTLYYARSGARHVTGIDIVPAYAAEATALAAKLGLSDRATFLTADAAAMPFPDASFDTIIANDAMEHVPDPAATLAECWRVLRPGGRMYINFPPYFHPYGAHLSDAIGIPWVHALFSEPTLYAVYRDLVKDLPDGADRVAFRFGTDARGRPAITYINRMTLRRFDRLLAATPFQVLYRHNAPLRSVLRPLQWLAPEFFTRMAVAVLARGR